MHNYRCSKDKFLKQNVHRCWM